MSLLPLLLLTAGSVGANKVAADKVKRARNRALDLAQEQRTAAHEKSSKAAQSTADLFVQAAKKQDDRAAELEAEFKGAQEPLAAQGQTPPASVLDVMAPTGSTATVASENAQRMKARGYTDQLAAARAKLAAFGDVMVDANIGANRNAMEIQQQAQNLSNWNQWVLPQQLEAANQRGRGWNTVGDALQFAAQLYSLGALTAPGAAVNTASTGTLGAETLAGAGAAAGGTAATDVYTQMQLMDFAKNLRQPMVGF